MRILLAEDEPDVRAFLLRALQHIVPAGQIEAVVDGQQALAAFTSRPADLIVSDHHMPNLAGLDLLRAIRAASAVPFVLISADPAVEVEARQAGCSAFIGKPISLRSLRDAIADLVPVG